MTALDYFVLLGTIVGISIYGMWRARGSQNLNSYLKGDKETGWGTIGLSVMATQASAITFLSTPGQAYESGMAFVQNYFGVPLALVIIAAVFLPIYRKLNVYTAYEYLGRRFDSKTRLLGAGLFLLQRGLAAGITIYAPAIILSTVLGWPLDLTIIGSGAIVILYTVSGGSEAVNVTQKYQMAVILLGMIAAFVVLIMKMPAGLGFTDMLRVAGGMGKLQAVDFSTNPDKRYTFWTGMLGGTFLSLSYFGTDQSQVQRYLSGASLRESRLGLMFNAVLKIPMQFFILLLGALVFVFYQFEKPPVFFNQTVWQAQANGANGAKLLSLKKDFATVHAEKKKEIESWLAAKHSGDSAAELRARTEVMSAQKRSDELRAETRKTLLAADPQAQGNDADYVFITFVLDYLPHGIIGLLIAVIFAAGLSSSSSELNALGSTTAVDFYKHVLRKGASDAHYVAASKWFTALWGVIAVSAAIFANLVENLIQAVNILGSIFYGVMLGIFLVAFFLKRVGGSAIFFAAIAAQLLVIAGYFTLTISYLWYNFIGCAACVLFSVLLQGFFGSRGNSGNLQTA
ncbi:MAG TPA: sodium:solute symporter [Verrucomicrobiae bacterium]|nr:sodium:solute symporter [Verrucomicrobiae bacterium]